jgi:hypothetical protein
MPPGLGFNLKKIRQQISLAAEIFIGPLLCFAAEISASWQHWCWSAGMQPSALVGELTLLTLIQIQLHYCV